jgi:hypothetical protein
MMKRRRLWVFWGVLLAGVLVVGAAAQVSSSFDARWSRPAAGGGERQSASFRVQDISGQWVGGGSASVNFAAEPLFFWAGDFPSGSTVYLPAIRR